MGQSTNADSFYDAVEPPLRQYSWQDENFIRQKKLQRKQGCTYEVLDILVDTISTP